MAIPPGSGVRYAEKNIKGVLFAEDPSSILALVKGDCEIGFMSYIGKGSEIYNTSIGRFCSIAAGLISGPTNHPIDRFSSHLFTFSNYGPFKGSAEFDKWIRSPALPENNKKIKIGNDVWIGRNVTIKRGIQVGDGAIIGAGSVVTKDVAPYSIVGGVPAKVIRQRFDDEIIGRLEKLRWHDYRIDRDAIPELDVVDIEKTLAMLERAIGEHSVEKLSPKKFKITAAEMIQL